jgi:protease-4
LIEIKEPLDNDVGKSVVEQIQYANNHPEIRGIVLALDSPGGTINDTELIYLELNHLRRKMPVVTMVQGLSASGAYYVSLATDFIYSNPSAMVGNVGVIGQIPPVPILLEEIYSTGPYKFWGNPRDTYVRQIDMMKRSFLKAVEVGRGDRLAISIEQVSRGEVYPASEALGYGLIDQLGSQSEAIEKAARLAHIANYEVVNLSRMVDQERSEVSAFYALDENGESTGYPREPGFYYLYIADFKGGLQ